MRKYDPVGYNNERGKSRMCIPLIPVINYTGRAASRQSGYLLFSFCFFAWHHVFFVHLLWPLKRDWTFLLSLQDKPYLIKHAYPRYKKVSCFCFLRLCKLCSSLKSINIKNFQSANEIYVYGKFWSRPQFGHEVSWPLRGINVFQTKILNCTLEQREVKLLLAFAVVRFMY